MVYTNTLQQLYFELTKKEKQKLLLIENNSYISNELLNVLEQFHDVSTAQSLEQAEKKLTSKISSNICVIITNLNLNSRNPSLMDGLSIARLSAYLNPNIPVIVYSSDINPLVCQEAKVYRIFKLLDQSQPNFNRQLLDTIKSAIEIGNWRKKTKSQEVSFQKIRNLLKINELLTPIQWNYIDENLYNCFFSNDKQNQYCYANSWAYICQSARNNGHKFFNGSCLITIDTKKTDVKNNFEFVIIRPLGQSAVKRTLELARNLKEISHNPVTIKKSSESQEKLFLESQNCHKLIRPASVKLEDQFDDIHPQVVVNLKAFMNNITSGNLFNFRSHVMKFNQKNPSIKTLIPELYDDLWDVVLKWKRSFIARYEKHAEFTDIPRDDRYYIDPYFPLFEYFSKSIDNRNVISSIVYIDNIPIGFSFLNRVSDRCMALYANIGDTDYEGLAEFMLYQNLTKAYWAGYRYVNLGGTESKYLYNFYKKIMVISGEDKSFEINSNYVIYE